MLLGCPPANIRFVEVVDGDRRQGRQGRAETGHRRGEDGRDHQSPDDDRHSGDDENGEYLVILSHDRQIPLRAGLLIESEQPGADEQEQVMESLDMENLPDALNLITQMILFEAPSKELQGNGIAPSDENNSQATSKTESDSPEGAEKN